jgi:single-strand DNA-binding protein
MGSVTTEERNDMPLARVFGEFGIVADPEIRFSDGGKAWVKIRGVAKDRVRDSNGAWSDGDPTFIDIIVFNEHIAESVVKGDTVIVEGKLQQNDWERDGVKHSSYRVVADSIGVSTRWQPAKTLNASKAATSTADVQESLGTTVVTETEPPF